MNRGLMSRFCSGVQGLFEPNSAAETDIGRQPLGDSTSIRSLFSRCDRTWMVLPLTVTARSFHTVGHTSSPSSVMNPATATGFQNLMCQKVGELVRVVQGRRDSFRPYGRKSVS
jgi:hypothetical protein